MRDLCFIFGLTDITVSTTAWAQVFQSQPYKRFCSPVVQGAPLATLRSLLKTCLPEGLAGGNGFGSIHCNAVRGNVCTGVKLVLGPDILCQED